MRDLNKESNCPKKGSKGHGQKTVEKKGNLGVSFERWQNISLNLVTFDSLLLVILLLLIIIIIILIIIIVAIFIFAIITCGGAGNWLDIKVSAPCQAWIPKI